MAVRDNKFFKSLVFVSAISLILYSCCGNQIRNYDTSQYIYNPAYTENAMKSTVALVKERTPESIQQNPGRGRWAGPYCAGFFVSNTEIISAAHCFQEILDFTLPDGTTIRIPIPSNITGKEGLFVEYGEINFKGTITVTPQVAKVVYYNFDDDVVVLRLVSPRAHNRHNYLRMANKAPEVGERVFNIGHPLTLSWTFASGIVSRVNRDSDSNNLIATVQVTNNTIYGCSGGPLINTQGRVVGLAHSFVTTPTIGIFISSEKIFIALREARRRQNNDTNNRQVEKLIQHLRRIH